MVLSDFGADVIRIDRVVPAPPGAPAEGLLARGRRSVGIDLKNAQGGGAMLELIDRADALIEGYRPGVMERLGLGPDVCLQRNPRLVYGRMTGWGQDGPYAHTAGHDINYVALAGALDPVGRRGEPPVPPLNYVGDFGGGGMLLALGITAALVEVGHSGRGQVVDAAMVEGAALLSTLTHELRAKGEWSDDRGTNTVDTGSHYYDVYETADGRYVSIGAVEPKFYAELLERIGLAGEDLPRQNDRDRWPMMRKRLADVSRGKTRAEWSALLEGTDICYAPVLGLGEAPKHPHNVHRGTFTEVDGVVQPAPAPRFSRTPAGIRRGPPQPREHTDEVLKQWAFDEGRIAALREAGAIA